MVENILSPLDSPGDFPQFSSRPITKVESNQIYTIGNIPRSELVKISQVQPANAPSKPKEGKTLISKIWDFISSINPFKQKPAPENKPMVTMQKPAPPELNVPPSKEVTKKIFVDQSRAKPAYSSNRPRSFSKRRLITTNPVKNSSASKNQGNAITKWVRAKKPQNQKSKIRSV